MSSPGFRIVGEQDLPELRARLGEATRVALDTEFHAERRYLPKLYLLQLHFDEGSTWLVDPLEPPALHALAEPLVSLDWVVHGGTQDMRILLDALGALPPRVWDTQIAAALHSDEFPAPYASLVERFLDTHVAKLATLSDWSRRPLSQRQLTYAAEDVQLLLPLWDAIWKALPEDRQPLVADACDEARAAVVDPPPHDLAWRSVMAARLLAPAEAAVLQELCAWRDETARRLDQPPRFVLGDGVVVELARRQPITVESLATNRRMPRSVLKKHGRDIVDRIQRAARRPEWAWPRPVAEGSPESRVVRWLELWARQDGAEHGYAQRLALSTLLAEDLAAARPATRELLANQLGDWRDALLGNRLWRALSGETSLRLGPPGVVVERDDPSTAE